jgi:hypothetical protein
VNSRGEKKLSIVCNNNIRLNPGRSTEHLAFHALARRHGFTNCQYFELLSPEDYFALLSRTASGIDADIAAARSSHAEYYADFPIVYEHLIGRLDELTSSDAIIFWSDWLHMPVFYNYYKDCLTNLGLVGDDLEAAALIDSHLYLTTQPDVILNKTISFGQTLLFNSLQHESSAGYGEAYRSFYKRARKAYMRDVFSARKISRLRGDYSNSNVCVDCATLLTERDIDALPTSVPTEDFASCNNKIAVFFGRSDVDVHQIMAVVETLTSELELQAFYLPWGVPFGFPQTKALPVPTVPIGGPRQTGKVGDLLAMMKRASVVITDTYHVCVNSWSMGIPAICIGSVLSKSDFDLNSGYRFAPIDKRYAFYSMSEALDFYIHEEEFRDAKFLKAHLLNIARLLAEPEYVRQIVRELRKESVAAEQRLVSEIDGILA